MATPNLAIPALVEGQTNSETTVNESLQIIDGIIAGRIEDRDLTAPPTGVDGKAYIVASSPSGEWSSKAGKIALYNSGWTFITPTGGMQFFVHDEKAIYCYSSVESEWFPVQPLHSTTEHWTGRYAEGGGKLYAKCFTGLACPNSATSTHSHSISNLDCAKQINFEASFTDGTTVSEFNFVQTTSIIAYVKVNATNILITTNFNLSGSTADIRIEYSKTS
tara:strand:+ start:5169 stop:5828 length:660 start_codon:yes stop_codon:yes gene_type:complete